MRTHLLGCRAQGTGTAAECTCDEEPAQLRAMVARLRSVLATLCYEAHVVVKANSTLSMAGLSVKPSFVKLYEAKEAAQAALSEPDAGGENG